MNPVKPPSVRPPIGQWFNVTFRTLFRGQSCEEVDCCGKTVKAPLMPDEVVVEKDVDPSYFCTWRPTIPKLEPPPPKKVNPVLPKKKRVCYAGMPSPTCNAEINENAKECLKNVEPSVMPQVKIQSCSSKELAQIRLLQSKRKSEKSGKGSYSRQKTMNPPEPDWDHDCIME
nr:uncharacterized protein LOC111505655 [Leptinotarsa decemlineata]